MSTRTYQAGSIGLKYQNHKGVNVEFFTRSLNRQCFIRYVTNYPPVVGEYGYISLYNPIGSGILTMLDSVIPFTPDANFKYYLTAQPLTLEHQVFGYNKYLGAAASLSIVSYDTSVTNPFTYIQNILRTYAQAGVNHPINEVSFRNKFVIAEGYGIFIAGESTNADVAGTLQWAEIPTP